MIDYEVKIFNRVHAAVSSLCAANCFISTYYTERPAAFPAASLIEIGNTTVRSRQSSTPVENYSALVYQLDVYATSKSKCRQVFAAADEAMIGMNFVRMSGQYLSITDNTKVFRYVARYEAEIDPDGNIYRRS